MTDEGLCVVPQKWREICVHRRPRRLPMPQHVSARPPLDATGERGVRKLAHRAHAPADWIVHAKLVVRSWDGQRTRQIAQELGCHPETVRQRLHAFTERGLDGLGRQPGSGRKPRLTQEERSTLLALVKRPPPGTPTDELTGELVAPDPEAEPEWTLETLTAAAPERGTLGGVSEPAADAGPRPPPRRPVPDCRHPAQPPQWSHPGLARYPPADPTRLHSGRRRLAQPHRGLVAPFPAQSLRRCVVGQRRRHRLRHRHRHRSAQPSRPPLDLGAATATTEQAPALLPVSLLRNDAITLICHVGTGSLCLLAARPVEVRWRAVCLPEEFSAHKG